MSTTTTTPKTGGGETEEPVIIVGKQGVSKRIAGIRGRSRKSKIRSQVPEKMKSCKHKCKKQKKLAPSERKKN
jgi:hypothetical protein